MPKHKGYDISILQNIYRIFIFNCHCSVIWIYTSQVWIKNIPYFNTTRKNLWLKNFGLAYCFFKISLTWCSSFVAPLTVKINVSFQIYCINFLYYFVDKNDFLYQLLAGSNSRPNFENILSVFVPWVVHVIAKHALYCLLSNFNSNITLPCLSYIIPV